jgi:hypothetical protein
VVFKQISVTSIAEVIHNVQQVEFPTDHFISSQEIVELKRKIKQNCDVMIAYAQHVLPVAAKGSYHEAILRQLRQDVMLVRAECGKVNANFAGAKHRSKLTQLHAAYEEMRLAAVLVCQGAEPELIDSLAVAL